MSVVHLKPIWSPEDGAQLLADIAAYPSLIGQSVAFDALLQGEGLSL